MHDWKDVQKLFLTAADLPVEEQTRFLDSECAGDEELRQELEDLFLGDRDAADALSRVVETEAALLIDSPMHPGDRVGSYRIEREIGRGGMGVVYLATRDDDQFQKQVAIKIVKMGTDTLGILRRFRHERQILANLEHPWIARLLDGGTTPDGRPWIAMEYVEGWPIDRFCEDRHLSLEERCRLICQVCDAVAYAHRHLVVHRDLKPTNILVAPDGSPKLLDFGIARLLGEAEAGGEEQLARVSSLSLTPDYASPEQIVGAPVTTASDVYSLGVVLHEVLTSALPRDPVKPSALETLPARTRRRLAGDLDSIVLMALSKDVSRRYRSADQMAEDIRRHLDGFPVQARSNTMLYRTGRFLRRNRTAVAAAFLVTASVVTGAVVDIRQANAARERFDQFRGFAQTVLVDLHAQLSDISGTAKARRALVTYVDGYLKRVAKQHAGDDAALATEFATTYLRLGEMEGATPEAIASFENGRRLLERARLNPADSLVLARLRVREGSTQLDLGRIPEGVKNLTGGATLAASLGEIAYPDAELVKAFANGRLARLHRMQYKLPEAEQEARAAIASGEVILARGFRTKEVYEVVNAARNVLGGVQRRQGHWAESMATYQKVLAGIEQRVQAEPTSASLERELARSHQILADMVVRMPGHDENQVRLHLRSAIAIADRLAALDPLDKTAQTDLAEYLSSGGEQLRRPEDSKESVSYLRRALPIFEVLLKSEPGNGDLRVYAAVTEAAMGQASSGKESIAWLRRGEADLTALVDSEPTNTTYRLELIREKESLSLRLAREGHRREAIALAKEVIGTARLVADDPGTTPESWRALPRAYAAAAATYVALGDHAEARQWYRTASAEWDKMIAKGLNFPDSAQEIEDARRGASAATPGR